MITAAIVRELVAAGLSSEELVAALERIEAAALPVRTARQERNARYYQNKKAREEEQASELRRLKTLSDDTASSLNDPQRELTTVEGNLNSPPLHPKEKTPKGVKKKGSPLPADWKPNELDRAWGRQRGLSDERIDRTADKMRNWAVANAHRDIARKLDWGAAFRNFMLDEIANGRDPPRKPSAYVC